MDIRITDLLDEYMYDDIPLDQMVTEVRGEPIFDQRKRPTARKRIGQIAAAILIVVSLSAAGMLYFGGGAGEAGGSLTSVEETPGTEPVEEMTPADNWTSEDQGYTLTMESLGISDHRLDFHVSVAPQDNMEYFSPVISTCRIETVDGETFDFSEVTSSDGIVGENMSLVYYTCWFVEMLVPDEIYKATIEFDGLQINGEEPIEGHWSFNITFRDQEPEPQPSEMEEAAVVTETPNVTYEIVVEEMPQELQTQVESHISMDGVSDLFSGTIHLVPGVGGGLDDDFFVSEIEVDEEYVTCRLECYSGRDIGVVVSEEQMLLGQAAEPELQFFVLEARTYDGTTVNVISTDVTSTDEAGVFQVLGKWAEPVDPENIAEIVLKAGK